MIALLMDTLLLVPLSYSLGVIFIAFPIFAVTKTTTMSQLAPCPLCKSAYTYEMNDLLVCPECGHEWSPAVDSTETPGTFVVKDSNGNVLADGDSVVTIKTLPVKGSSQSIKAGTKVRNIRLVDSDHNIDCKIDGFGAMALKSEFVKKA